MERTEQLLQAMRDCLIGIPRPNYAPGSSARDEEDLDAAPVAVELDVAYARELYMSLPREQKDALHQRWEQFEAAMAQLVVARASAMTLHADLGDELEHLDDVDATAEPLDREAIAKALGSLAQELPASSLTALLEIARGISETIGNSLTTDER